MAWLLVLAIFLPRPGVVTASADKVEINEHWPNGRYSFTQAILWRQYGSEYHVSEWRMIPAGEYTISYRGGVAVVSWMGRDGDLYRVRTRVARASRTTYDPERLDLDELQESRRQPQLVEPAIHGVSDEP